MANPVIGRNIILYKYDAETQTDIPWACALDAILTVTSETKEVTSQSSAWWREYKYSFGTWTISVSGLIILNTQYNYLLSIAAQRSRETITVKFVIDNGGVDGLSIFSGQALIIENIISSPDIEKATYETLLQGSGEPSISGTIVTPGGTIIIQNTTVQVFQTTATEGQTVITFSGAVGLELLYASRGGIGAQPLFLLEGNGCTWNSATSQLTLATPAVEGENILILAQ